MHRGSMPLDSFSISYKNDTATPPVSRSSARSGQAMKSALRSRPNAQVAEGVHMLCGGGTGAFRTCQESHEGVRFALLASPVPYRSGIGLHWFVAPIPQAA